MLLSYCQHIITRPYLFKTVPLVGNKKARQLCSCRAFESLRFILLVD